MGCCRRNKNQRPWTKTVTLTFLRSELLKDIGNNAYVEADVMKTDDEHDRHQVFDIVQDRNVERVTRVLDLTFAEVNELCYPFTKADVEDYTSDTNIYEEAYEYTICMNVPNDFSQTTVVLLKQLIQELLTCRVLEDWFSITKPESAANWGQKAENVRIRINRALFARTGRTRRTLSPF